MNLIEQLGGYEKSKRELELKEQNSIFQCCIAVDAEMIRDALLQYRREHGIYEVGDKVAYRNLPYTRLFYIKAVLDDSIVVRECWDEAGAKCFSEFEPYPDICHATDAEIKANKRLEVGL